MKLVIFGLSVSSSWGNGHATLWRGLCRALGELGHDVVFFEKDVPYYRSHRDLEVLPGGGQLVLYADLPDAMPRVRRELAEADVAMVTSYCPDARAVVPLLFERGPRCRVFYDLDTPVTFDRLDRGEDVAYVPEDGLGAFDLVLSYTGGRALHALVDRLGARRVAPLYGSVDPHVHRPAVPSDRYAADLSHLGTWSPDRHHTLLRLFVAPAASRPDRRFVLGGSMYPSDFPRPNIRHVEHVPPHEHATFYGSSRLTLNVTRGAMARYGFCPSGRIFEAAACGIAVVTDVWEGLDRFYAPGTEILAVHGPEDVSAALDRSDAELAAMAAAARERTLEEHTADRRATELVALLEGALSDPSRFPSGAEEQTAR